MMGDKYLPHLTPIPEGQMPVMVSSSTWSPQQNNKTSTTAKNCYLCFVLMVLFMVLCLFGGLFYFRSRIYLVITELAPPQLEPVILHQNVNNVNNNDNFFIDDYDEALDKLEPKNPSMFFPQDPSRTNSGSKYPSNSDSKYPSRSNSKPGSRYPSRTNSGNMFHEDDVDYEGIKEGSGDTDQFRP